MAFDWMNPFNLEEQRRLQLGYLLAGMSQGLGAMSGPQTGGLGAGMMYKPSVAQTLASGLQGGVAGLGAYSQQNKELAKQQWQYMTEAQKLAIEQGKYGLEAQKAQREQQDYERKQKLFAAIFGTGGLGTAGGAALGNQPKPALTGDTAGMKPWYAKPTASPTFTTEHLPPRAYAPTIQAASGQYNIPSQGLAEQAHYESGFNPNARGKAGELGIMQIMPGTASDLGIDPLDPQESIYGGAQYMRQLNDKYGGDWAKTLAAYNFGMGNVDKGREWPASTKKYVSDLLPYFQPAQAQQAGAPAPAQPGMQPPSNRQTPGLGGWFQGLDPMQKQMIWSDLGMPGQVPDMNKAPATHGNLQWDDNQQKWVPIPGYVAPGLMEGVIVDENGNIKITKTGRADVEKRRINSGEMISRLDSIFEIYKPKYLTYGAKLKAAWQSIRAKMGSDLSQDQRAFLADFSTFKQLSIDNLNQVLHDLSGAAITPAEAERLKAAMPDPGTGLFDGDDPVTFKTNLDTAIKMTKLAVARYNYMLTKGIPSDSPEAVEAFTSLNGMESIIEQIGAQLEAQIKAQYPDAPDDMVMQEVQARLAQELGY